MNPRLQGYLEKTIGLSGAEIAGLEQGRAAAKILPSRQPDEIAVFSVVRIEVPPDYLFRAYQNIEKFEPANAKEYGLFQQPPQLSDLAKLTLEPKDLEALRKCKPGNCDVQMPANAIRKFQALDWNNPQTSSEAATLQRQLILDYVKLYLEKGDDALLTYNDRKQPQALRESWKQLLEQTPELFTAVPQLMKHLQEYPRDKSPATMDRLLWIKTDAGGDTLTTSVGHVFLHEEKQADQAVYVIGVKVLFASHLFQDGLTLRYLVPAGPKAHYFLSLSRAHVPELGGFKGRMLRGTLSGKMRDNLADFAVSTKKVMEDWYAEYGGK